MTEHEAVLAARVAFGHRLRVLKPCLACGEPVDGTRCDQCSRAKERERVRRNQRSYRWRILSQRIRRRSPFCERCGSTVALTVDHVVPVSMGGAEYDEANLRVLCKPCHGHVWAEQRRANAGVMPRGKNALQTAPQPSARLEESPSGA